jgi:type III pantothenate kinase
MMVVLLDIGNTNTHAGLAGKDGILEHCAMPTAAWGAGRAENNLLRFARNHQIEGCVICSVVPKVTRLARRFAGRAWGLQPYELTWKGVTGIGIDYPQPQTIGADRLANAMAAHAHYGAPVVVVDFGTAVTFDIVNRQGNYMGGIIAPGLSAMTGYLHEKTALLPRISLSEPAALVGKSTEEAMLSGTVHGYRGLVQGLIKGLKLELKSRRLPVVATGGYAGLISSKIPEISALNPLLTLEGLRLVWERRQLNS